MATGTDKRKKKKKKKPHRFFWFFIKLQIVLMLVVLAGFGFYYFGGYADEVQTLHREAVQEVAASDESVFIPDQTCSIYDTNGELISERKGSKDAQYVRYEDIPKEFASAIISIEDKKFYKHHGVDFKAVIRVIKARLEAGRITQGGSTITMQLTSMDQDVDGIKNYNIAVKKRGEDITFLRRIVQGPADDSYGIEVAKLAGLPEAVIKRAHAVLRQLEATAPGANKAMQLDFETVEAYNNPAVPSEVVDKLNSLDIETLTPIEALNFLYELKQALK